MPQDEAYLARHQRSLGARSLRVLSTENHGVHFVDLTRSQDREHDQPDFVIDAIREMYSQSK